jgi:hypothetical protein
MRDYKCKVYAKYDIYITIMKMMEILKSPGRSLEPIATSIDMSSKTLSEGHIH